MRVWCLVFRVDGLGFRVESFGFRVESVGFKVEGSWLRVKAPRHPRELCVVRYPPSGELPHTLLHRPTEREFFIDNLMVRIHLIIVMISVDRPCAMGVSIPFSR